MRDTRPDVGYRSPRSQGGIRLRLGPAVAFFFVLACSALSKEPELARTPAHQEGGGTPAQGPVVGDPVAAQTATEDAAELPPVETRQPGDTVREMPDLAQTPSSGVSRAIAPQKLRADLRQLSPSPLPLLDRSTFGVAAGPPAGPSLAATAGGLVVLRGHGEGERLAGPVPLHRFWSTPEEPCAMRQASLPNVLYDAAAGRWLVARFTVPTSDGSFPLCVALSRSDDPVAGGWTLYRFSLPLAANDPRFVVTGHDYSLVIDLGPTRTEFLFDRRGMLRGAPATYRFQQDAEPALPRRMPIGKEDP